MLPSSSKQSELLLNPSLIQSLGVPQVFESLANILLQTSACSPPCQQSVEGSVNKGVGEESKSQCSSMLKEHNQRIDFSHSQASGVPAVLSAEKPMQGLDTCTQTSKGDGNTANKSSGRRKRAQRPRGFTAEKPDLPESSKTAPCLSRSISPLASPRLTQTSLQLTADNTVAVTAATVKSAAHNKKKKGSSTPGSQRKRHRRGNQPAASHTIPELFQSSGSPTLVQYSHCWSGVQNSSKHCCVS